MADMAYIASRALENKIAIAENNDLNIVVVPLIMMKETLAILKEQEKKFFVDSDGKITPIPIIRCKDCKHGEPCNEDVYCTKEIGTIESSVHKPDWFCADARRRD